MASILSGHLPQSALHDWHLDQYQHNPLTQVFALTMTPDNPLQRLRDLDKTSTLFHEELSNFIRGDVYRSALLNLQDENLTWLVEYLDGILFGVSDHKSPAFQEFLHELKQICGIKEVLPESCTLPEPLLGCVYEGTFNGSKVRIRRVRVPPGEDTHKAKEIFHQVAVLSKYLAHRNIVPLLGVTLEPLELVSDWMPGGDLPGYITKHPDADRLSLLSDVAQGLRYLHSCGVIHGDLRGSTILVDETGHARITDIGIALITQDPVSIWSASPGPDQNLRWIAPEILEDRGTYGKEADVFSFAGVMIEVFTGAVPFDDEPPHMARLVVIGGERPPRPAHPALTDELWTLMQCCWNETPHLRPHAARISWSFVDPSWKRLINSPPTLDERIPLITDVLSDPDETEVAKGLCGDDAQSFVDVADEMLGSLGPPHRQMCLSVLCKICRREALLPRQLQIPLCYDRSEDPLYSGGFSDVWKGEHQGTEVAVKVMKVVFTNIDKIRRRFCKEVITWRSLCHPNVLPLLGVTMTNQRFAMISEWMNNGNINEFIKAHTSVNRFELLKDVTRGLIYLHDQALIHADLKGANILIDQSFHARLADFGLLTLVSDPTNPIPPISTTNFGGTFRWMSPEFLNPEKFGLEYSRPTKESDCYALGMVMFEVLGGRAPFARYNEFIVIQRVVDGEHPGRPESTLFTDDMWGTLQQCWSYQPEGRPTVEVVLERLGRVSVAFVTDFRRQAQQRLMNRSFSRGELSSFLETVFRNREWTHIIQRPQGAKAQAIVDILDEALNDPKLPSNIRNKCIQSLHEICTRHALPPGSLIIELCDSPADVVPHPGGFADVSRRKYQGQQVAVKVLNKYTTGDSQTMVQQHCKELMSWKALQHPNVLPLIGVVATEDEFAIVSEWMLNGNINQFIEGCQDANRFELLSDVAEGLSYVHNQGVIHGNLKGANVLVDHTCHARLADFGLLTLLPDSIIPNSYTRNGAIRWMSPELLDPKFQDRRRTKYSDCYGLGMLIYEILSRHVPFHRYGDSTIYEQVVQGGRPERLEGVEGVWFTDDIWEVLERCWAPTPQDRPSIDNVLLCLEKTSKCCILPSPAPPMATTSLADSFARWLPACDHHQ